MIAAAMHNLPMYPAVRIATAFWVLYGGRYVARRIFALPATPIMLSVRPERRAT